MSQLNGFGECAVVQFYTSSYHLDSIYNCDCIPRMRRQGDERRRGEPIEIYARSPLRLYEIVRMCDVKLMSDDGKLAEGSMSENFRSNGDTQTTTSQRHPVIGKCKSVSTLIDEPGNHQPLLVKTEKSKMFEKTTSGSGQKQINVEGEARSEKKTFESTEGAQKQSEQSIGRKRMFSLLDTLISLNIVGPLAIGFWRGIWTWMDFHAELFPAWFCFTSGTVLHVIFAFYKDRFHDSYMNEWTKLSAFKRLPYRALRILYTYTFGVACNAHWRGSWLIIDDYFLMHVWITICLMCLLLACLAILRCVRNLIAPPLIIFIDTPAHVFQFPTRYNVPNTRLR